MAGRRKDEDLAWVDEAGVGGVDEAVAVRVHDVDPVRLDLGVGWWAFEVDGEAVGGIGVHRLDDVRRQSAEIGYWLTESCWGRGIATDAVRSMVPAAFEAFDIVRLEAGIFSSNPSSMRVLEKCGFVREAVHAKAITKNGVLLDEVVYVYFD